LNSNLQIFCQDLPSPDGFDLKNKSKPWIRSVDYHLQCCIEARFWKLASTGSNLGFLKSSTHLAGPEPIMVQGRQTQGEAFCSIFVMMFNLSLM
jgi:hypothetical protein